MYLFLLHCLLLAGASFGAARQLTARTADRLLTTALLGWGNIVVTCLLLSGLQRLGSETWFLRTSVALAAATWLLLRRIRPEPAAPADGDDRIPGALLAAFILTLAPLVWASIRIATTYVPNNFDSLAYHLPRAMFYLGQNSLAHFSTGNDRQIYFPFNFNLLQLFGLIYGPPLQALNFINLAAWAVAGVALFRLGRLGGFSARAALIATWVVLTSTQVLAQATATTNDLPTGAGLIVTLVFALRWRQSRLSRDALLAGLAAGLTAGSKLTVIFFGPAAGLILLALAWQHWRRREVREFFRGVRAWLVPAALAFTVAAPFALINLVEKGQWVTHRYDYTLNRPVLAASAVQTTKAYLVQLFVEPLHRFTVNQGFTELLNRWGERTLFPHWDAAHAFSPFYLFPPDLNEDHVWFGFAGPFIFLCAVCCLVRIRRLPAPVVWLAVLGLGWFATYFVLNRWSLYNQRYFILPLLVLGPCVAACVEAGLASAAFRRMTRDLLVLLAGSALWLAGIYLFQNTSRPYAPLWAGRPAPPALPELPAAITRRLAGETQINFDSTDGNERTFLFMAVGRHQRFIASNHVEPDFYNVFSQWGFPRKVAYSNIEQLSSYTIVRLPTKRTAGVEHLGTIGTGEPALDYYGLVPHPERVPSTEADRNVMVELSYRPREPDRYADMRVKVAGLNAPDEARLVLGVEYDDLTTEDLASFTTTGEARVSVTRPFRRFTVRVEAQPGGERLGSIDIPYLFRNLPPDIEAPDDPTLLFAQELILPKPDPFITVTGLVPSEGPYPQWNLPLIRWAKAPVVRLEIPATERLSRLETTFSVRLEARSAGHMDVVFNGRLVREIPLAGSSNWATHTVQLEPQPGRNVLEFRNVKVGPEPDWEDYLERYPDVKNFLVAQQIPLEKGALEHYELKGKAENRLLFHRRQTESLPGPDQLYYLFRTLRVHAFRNP